MHYTYTHKHTLLPFPHNMLPTVLQEKLYYSGFVYEQSETPIHEVTCQGFMDNTWQNWVETPSCLIPKLKPFPYIWVPPSLRRGVGKAPGKMRERISRSRKLGEWQGGFIVKYFSGDQNCNLCA